MTGWSTERFSVHWSFILQILGPKNDRTCVGWWFWVSMLWRVTGYYTCILNRIFFVIFFDHFPSCIHRKFVELYRTDKSVSTNVGGRTSENLCSFSTQFLYSILLPLLPDWIFEMKGDKRAMLRFAHESRSIWSQLQNRGISDEIDYIFSELCLGMMELVSIDGNRIFTKNIPWF